MRARAGARIRPLLALALLGGLSACAGPGGPGAPGAPKARDSRVPAQPVQDLVLSVSQALAPSARDRLAGRRAIFLAEVHDRPEHHRGQLAVIRALHEHGVDLALGLESFQRPFQSHLDDYGAGRIGERELLRRTGYAQRWGFDYGLYREILVFARARGIPLVALNASRESVERVSRGGLAALSAAERQALPNPPELAQGAYRRRLVAAFGGHGGPHGGATPGRMGRFLEVQMLWDETMAASAADFLIANPDKTLAILAGAAHVGYVDAVPRRLWRRLPVPQAWVFPDLSPATEPVHPSPRIRFAPEPHLSPSPAGSIRPPVIW